jgi:hypothetical protein
MGNGWAMTGQWLGDEWAMIASSSGQLILRKTKFEV